MSLAEVGLRPTLDNEERDDAKEILKLAIASIQRERGFADQCYMRGRNAFAVTATVFTAAQAAFVSSVGRQVGGKALLTSSEKGDILIPAAFALVLLIGALGVLVFWLDRPREMRLIGAQTLRQAWLDPGEKYVDTPVLEVLVVDALKEEEAWAASNEDRRKALRCVGILCGFAAVAAISQLFVLYLGLS